MNSQADTNGYLRFLSSFGLLIGSFLNLLLALASFFGLQWGPGRMDLYRRFKGINLLDLILTVLLLVTALLLLKARKKIRENSALFLAGILLAAVSLFLYGAGLCLIMHTNAFLMPCLIILAVGILLFFFHRSFLKRNR